MDCRVAKYGEDVGLMLAGKFGKLRLKKGKHLLDFISTECPDDHYEVMYTVEDIDFDDFMEVKLRPLRDARMKALAEAEKVRKEEEARKAEEARLAEQKRIEEEARKEMERLAELQRKEEEARLAEQKRIEDEVRKAEELAREERKLIEAQKRKEEEARLAEQRRLAEARKKEEARKAEELREAEEQRLITMVAEGKGRDGIYKVGDYYNVDGKEGVVFDIWDNGRHGKIVSVDEVVLKWCLYEKFTKNDVVVAYSKNNGKINTDKVMARVDKEMYSAFTWCRSKGMDWYIPAIEELKVLLLNDSVHDKVNYTLHNKRKQSLANNGVNVSYWSSSEMNFANVWYVGMRGKSVYYFNKGSLSHVRAVAEF